MAELTLEVEKREKTGKGAVGRLRREGKIPAVVYGADRGPVPVVVDRRTIADLINKSEHGVRSIFLLSLAGTDAKRHAMIKEIQFDPVSQKMDHIDFIRVMMDEVITVTVPIQVKGTAEGVKNEGGILDFQMREIEVECLPSAIPDEIVIDVSPLHVHQSIRIEDLTLPEGVKVLDDADRIVVGVVMMRAEPEPEAEAAAAAEAPAEPELIRKGKAEDDDEEPEEQEKKEKK